ncbi:MAG TPA: preprotein translocase subunit SecA [Thermobifida alba]|nr:preprotein translocase subunit SecA [Thermobifida alba]
MPGILDRVLRAGEGKVLRRLKKLKDQINSIEDDFVDLSDAELRELTDEYKQRLKDGEELDDLLPEAFATVREAAKRTLGQRHFDVQLMGGAALHFGNIAEMKTGEGKTLTATLPVYLNALTGKGVHVVTVNDYLARRDAETMGRIYQFLGLEVGVISPEMSQADRRKAYEADITYGTNNEFGFDYLRDNMARSIDNCVQRGHHFAIVDEVDSILIDEARTPLIISGPAEQNSRWYTEFAKIAPRLRRDVDYEVDEKKRTVGITESGVAKVEDWLGIENLYEAVNTPLISFLNNAIKAKELYRRDKEYIVKDGEVLIVDEFTGRVLRGRRYNEGMHQAIEAKEKVKIKDENQTLAKITLQNYFRLYEKLAGMTGTAATEAAEFHQTYKLGVVPIPTNKPMIREDLRDVVYKTEEAKFEAVVEDIAECHEKGQPVLVGTTSVEKSELLSKMLKRRGIPHEVLNAKNHAREAAIVARAGKLGAVTVATNMAGRGTDIMLGGNPDFIAAEELSERGLSPLETPEEYEKAWPEALEKAKKEVEAEHEQVVEAGGLYVLGTERHESRRIDNQLRGRSGRQGDPGKSRFYLSLRDDLMRLFNSERVQMIMDRLNLPDDQPIESGMVTKAIQSAQSQVEQQNFEIRKNVLKYDEVLNRQRKVVYAERRKVLEGADLREQVEGMIDDVLDSYVRSATAEGDPEDWDLDRLWTAFGQVFPVSFTADQLIEENGGDISALTPDIISQRVREDAHELYERREAEIGEQTMREVERQVILQVMDRKWREHLYEMDYLQEGIGLRAMAQRNPLIEYQREGYDMFQEMLEGIKEESVRFLFNVEVRVNQPQAGGITAASAAATASAIPVVTPDSEKSEEGGAEDSAAAEAPAAGEAPEAEKEKAEKAEADGEKKEPEVVVPGLGGTEKPAQLQYTGPSEGGGVEKHTESNEPEYAGTPRNAPCPCGSGKKYKKCHGAPKTRV